MVEPFSFGEVRLTQSFFTVSLHFLLGDDISWMSQTSTTLNYLWLINHLLGSRPFPGLYLGTNLTPQSFLARLFFIYVFDFLCISVIVVLAHSPSCRQLLFLGFPIQKEQSLFRDFAVILSFPLSYDPAAFFKFKSLGRPFEMLKRQDNILYKREKVTKKRLQNQVDTRKRTGK